LQKYSNSGIKKEKPTEKRKKQMNLSQEDKEKLEEHIQGIARILYQNTSSDKLKTFEDIEMTLREEIQEEVSPEIAKFFFQKLAKLKSVDREK
jgi:hypothetical protein